MLPRGFDDDITDDAHEEVYLIGSTLNVPFLALERTVEKAEGQYAKACFHPEDEANHVVQFDDEQGHLALWVILRIVNDEQDHAEQYQNVDRIFEPGVQRPPHTDEFALHLLIQGGEFIDEQQLFLVGFHQLVELLLVLSELVLELDEGPLVDLSGLLHLLYLMKLVIDLVGLDALKIVDVAVVCDYLVELLHDIVDI